MILLFYCLIIIAVLLIGVVIYNSLVRMRNAVRNAWALIDVQLKRRHDLIPNLVEVVKDYMGYEQETLTKVVEARSKAVGAQSIPDKMAAENQLTASLRGLFVVAENYPDLKANQNVSALQQELALTENAIANARANYNDTVLKINNSVEVFPSNLIAKWFNFQSEKYYDIPPEEREPFKVDLRPGN
jgi:LemA protein